MEGFENSRQVSKIESVNINSAEQLIVQLQETMSMQGKLSREEVEEANEMIRTLQELQAITNADNINIALTKLHHIKFQTEKPTIH